MSLQLLTQIIQTGNTSFTIYDVTGSTGSGGWGVGGNPVQADVTSAIIEIESNTYTTPIQLVIDVSGGYDTVDITQPTGMQITALAALGVDSFPDGYYEITLILVIGADTYEYTNRQGFLYDIRCCLRKKAIALKLPLQNSQQILDAALAQYLLIAMEWSACCGNTDAYLNMLSYLNTICEDCGRFSTSTTPFSPCGCQ